MIKKFGIDVSRWQGKFDFKQAKKEGVDFAILKIGGGDDGLYKDKEFENNYKKCNTAKMPVGCYFFGKALNLVEAEKEAYYWLDLMKGKRFDYPVYYDVEADMLRLGKSQVTSIIETVCSIVEAHGYFVGVYASVDHFNYSFDDTKLKRFAHWGACWSSVQPSFKSGAFLDMWQFGGEKNFIRENKIAGVVCDQNYCFVDYPSIIKGAKLNNTTTEVILEDNEKIANEVIRGLWGNGEARRQMLIDSGYDYEAIQKIVNEKMGV